MAQVKLINKTDFLPFVNIGNNVKDELINSHIDDAERFDVLVELPSTMILDIQSQFIEPIRAWSRTATYNQNDLVRHEEQYSYYWKSTSASPQSGNEPTGSSPVWQKVQLLNFFENYIKPFWVCKAASRFLLWHGRNVTQFGLRNMLDDTSEAISDKARGELIDDIDRKAAHYKTQINLYLKQVEYTFDGTVYEKNEYTKDNRKGAFKIFQV
jgi:hypothetical protein